MQRGLGRGLSALIPGAENEAVVVSIPEVVGVSVRSVAVDDIRPNPYQPRRTFTDRELDNLAASIREHGILQPLVVSVDGQGGYELLAGERRLRAAQRAGLSEVPVVVRPTDDSNQAKLELALIENIQREDLNPIDRGVAYQQLQEEFGLTQDDVAKRVGIARSSVAHTIRILALPEDMRDALRGGKLSEGHAKVLVGMENAAEQRAWFERILQDGLSVAMVASAQRDELIEGLSSNTERRLGGDPNLRAKERLLEQTLGARTRIQQRSDGRGKITIAFHDTEELGGILESILGET